VAWNIIKHTELYAAIKTEHHAAQNTAHQV